MVLLFFKYTVVDSFEKNNVISSANNNKYIDSKLTSRSVLIQESISFINKMNTSSERGSPCFQPSDTSKENQTAKNYYMESLTHDLIILSFSPTRRRLHDQPFS